MMKSRASQEMVPLLLGDMDLEFTQFGEDASFLPLNEMSFRSLRMKLLGLERC
jgi:hypothetical protein